MLTSHHPTFYLHEHLAMLIVIVLQVVNTSPTPMTNYKGTTLGEFMPLSEVLLVESQQLASSYTASLPLSGINLSESELSPHQHQQLLALLHDYTNLFATDNGPRGCTLIVKHAIHVEGHPIHQPKALHDTIDTEVQQMLQNRII